MMFTSGLILHSAMMDAAASVSAQVLASSVGCGGPFDHHCIQYHLQLRNVMMIRSGRDE